jgi:uncharacterized protein
MAQMWFSMADCPTQGRRLFISDQNIWADPLGEFDLGVAIAQPLQVELFILPQNDGLLLQGSITGQVFVACDRCAESMPYELDVRFDVFESLQGKGEQEEYAERFRQARQGLELDLAAVLWEQFVLALPIKPLCTETCQGICPQCGANLNHGQCECPQHSLDPRLAILRNLEVGRR